MQPLAVPSKPSEVARVTFEIARRHRFARDMADIPEGITVHVLPYGGRQPGDDKLGAYRRMDDNHRRIEAAYLATTDFLADVA